ncbi:hypothetical protein R3P38DRAFT_2769483 [Favolaschia claudopus]|uniref:TNT domain-containing protein n=1 Tax=Favolaschia claudopus TaxID=2862362 RepID=A0AAW0CLF2_9AGAR
MLHLYTLLLESWLPILSMLAGPALVSTPLTERCTCRGAIFSNIRYLCGDWRLGPAILPSGPPFNILLANYERLAGLCPDEFLRRYTNRTNGDFLWPPYEGFHPTSSPHSLEPGTLLDRFGNEGGRYLSPANTPFAHRALPPASLNRLENGQDSNDSGGTASYYLYRVERRFTVLTGIIAPWFEQRGAGTQYLTPRNVGALVEEGFLSRVLLD